MKPSFFGRRENTIHRAAWSQLKTTGNLFYAASSFVHHFIAINEFKLELQSGNAQFGSKLMIFVPGFRDHILGYGDRGPKSYPRLWKMAQNQTLDDRKSQQINSLAPGRFDHSLKLVNFKLISTIKYFLLNCYSIRWRPQHLTGHKSTLVQVMSWCRQATSHHLSQCWPRSLSPYDVTRSQWVNHFWSNFA